MSDTNKDEAPIPWPERLANSRGRLLEMLREHQPLVILSSLSLVIAGFVQAVSAEAAGFAAAAAVAFLMGLVSSMGYEVDGRTNLYLASLAVFGIVAGILILLGVVWLMIQALPAARVAYLLIFRVALVVVFIAALTSRIRSADALSHTASARRLAVGLSWGIVILGAVGLAFLVAHAILAAATGFPTGVQFLNNLESWGLILFVVSVVSPAVLDLLRRKPYPARLISQRGETDGPAGTNRQANRRIRG